MTIVREVKERSGTTPVTAPSAPSQTGFPAVQHRSQRVSQFKRNRKETTTARQDDPIPAAPPFIRSSNPSSSPASASTSTDIDPSFQEGTATPSQILRQCHSANEDQVKRMTASEREREIAELEEMVSPGLMALFRERAERKVKEEMARVGNGGGEKDGEGSAGNRGMEGQAREMQTEMSDSHKVEAEQNAQTKPRSSPTLRPTPLPATFPTSFPNPLNITAPTASTDNKRQTADDAILSPSAIHDRYFPLENPNPPALEWLQPVHHPSGEPSTSQPLGEDHFPGIRFNLDGRILGEEEINTLGVEHGLHHHGAEGEKAGYTVQEIFTLCGSTFIPQRTMMLSLMGKIFSRYDSYAEEQKRELERGGFKKKVLDMVVRVFCSGEKNAAVLRQAIAALSGSVGARCRGILEGDEGEDEVVLEEVGFMGEMNSWISMVPVPAVLERISQLLQQPINTSSLLPPSIYHLIAILLAMAISSIPASTEIEPLLPLLIRNFVLKLDWPVTTSASSSSPQERQKQDQAMGIAEMTIRLLRVVTMGSRQAAKSLLEGRACDGLLRFLAVEPWQAGGGGGDGKMWRLPSLVLDGFEKVGRYGLNGGLLANLSGVWVSLGLWVGSWHYQAGGTSAEELRFLKRYFKLLRIWVISAKDPHSMEVEHDLTWTQVAGFGWQTEGLHIVRELCPGKVEGETSSRRVAGEKECLTAAVEFLAAWQESLVHNTVEAERREVLEEVKRGLEELRVEEMLQGVLEQIGGAENGQAGHFGAEIRFANALLMVAKAFGISVGDVTASGAAYQASLGRVVESLQSQTRTNRQDIASIAQLQSNLLDLDPASKAGVPLKHSIIHSCHPGQEQLALELIDSICRQTLGGVNIDGTLKQDLEILQPFYSRAILPSLEELKAPEPPNSKTLKLVARLRSGSARKEGAAAGLPLRPDWPWVPFEQYLKADSKEFFKTLPDSWNATRLEMVRATLKVGNAVFAKETALPGYRPYKILNAMKVFLLETMPTPTMDEASQDMFLDPETSSLLKTMVADLVQPEERPTAITLEDVAAGFIPSGTTFYQMYDSLVQLYDAVSYGDLTFSQIVIAPLAQTYPSDFRKIVWLERPTVLRSLRLRKDQVLLEQGSVEHYCQPVEKDIDVLQAYVKALSARLVTKAGQPFLYDVAVHHLREVIKAKEMGSKELDRLEAVIKRDVAPEVQAEIFVDA